MWGAAAAITMALREHGHESICDVGATAALLEAFSVPVLGLGTLIVASWMIIMVNLLEIGVWSGFFLLKGAMTNPSSAFYYALANYTTLDSGYLPRRWRLLEGMLAMAGLLTCAWSTGVLFMLVQEFQETQLKRLKQRRGKHDFVPAPSASDQPGASG
jgi:hypothetical protein